MKFIFSIFVIFLGSTMCTSSGNIPKYFQSENVVWGDDDKVFILVRHAEKQKGDDPELTAAGKKRAKKLSSILMGINDLEIHSSDYKRTKATVGPIADRMKEDLSIYDAGKLGDFATSLEESEAGIYLISGHSNSTPTLANDLCNCTVFPKIDESDYTNIYVVVLSDSTSSTYLLNY